MDTDEEIAAACSYERLTVVKVPLTLYQVRLLEELLSQMDEDEIVDDFGMTLGDAEELEDVLADLDELLEFAYEDAGAIH